MILEGVSSLRREFRRYISFGIFVATPEAVCLQRGIDRDARTGKPRQELLELWQHWLADENSYIKKDQPQQYANLVIDGTRPFEGQIT